MKKLNINKKKAGIKPVEIIDPDKKLDFAIKTIFTKHYMEWAMRRMVNKNTFEKEADEIEDEITYMLTGENKISCIVATMNILVELLIKGAKMYKVGKNYVLDGPINISMEE